MSLGGRGRRSAAGGQARREGSLVDLDRMTHQKGAPCPSREQLADLALGRLPEPEMVPLFEHASSCGHCQAVLEELDRLPDELLTGVRDAASREADSEDQELEDLIARVEVLRPGAASRPGGPSNGADLPEQLGQYRLLEKLGQGGMGTVYKALHTKLKRAVALKVITDRRLHSPDAIARFHKEMEAVGGLDHPNIVRAHDAGEAGGRHFLVMEFVEGKNLAQLVRSAGPLSAANACEVIRQAAIGLGNAHEHGLVHRDVKPSNLMLTPDGTVKVLDLGLARLRAQEAEPDTIYADDTQRSGDVTSVGQVLGSRDFMAPEQKLDSREVDPRADVYSLGCTLFFLLTGKPPFDGPPGDAHGSGPLDRLPAEVPSSLAALLAKMLAHDPADRPSNMQEVIDTLASTVGKPDLPGLASQHQGGPAALTLGKRLRRIVVGLVLLAVLSFVAWQWQTIIIHLRGQGEVIVEGDVADVTLALDRDGAEPITFDLSEGSSIRVAAGRYTLRASGGRGPYRVAPGQVMVKIGDTATVTIYRLDGLPNMAPPSASLRSAPPSAETPAVQAGPTVVNSVGMGLVLIPAGEFLMGSPDSDTDALKSEKPQHRMFIAKPFYMGIHEVTVGQFRQFVEATGYETAAERDPEKPGGWLASFQTSKGRWVSDMTWHSPGFRQTDQHPVVAVSWADADAFCRWLSEKEARTYRLPTEAEWEYACRAGTTAVRHTGDHSPDEVAWYAVNSGGRTHPVGRKPPNAFGLYDMYGNAREWCADWHNANLYARRLEDPAAEPRQMNNRSVRGGCYMDAAQFLRSAIRINVEPTERMSNLGFRVVRVL